VCVCVCVRAVDLTVNHIRSIAYGWLAAFPLLRKLDLSFNCLSSLEGLGVAFHIRELAVSHNRIGSYKPPVMARKGV
jgi:Leucine-rich repeat (LRR) protein